MPAKVSPTLKVLMEIRDAVRATNERVDKLDVRLAHVEEVMAVEMHANRAVMLDLVELMRDRRDRHDVRLENHERRLRALERRTG
jgi:hypothetical protein